MIDTPGPSAKKNAEELLNLGNFEIVRDGNGSPLMLGKGSFGRTYKARHRFLDTVVALKVINERYARDPVVRKRFLVEGKAVARLSHPHIARLHDFGEADGALYYAMEFCSGGNLADYALKQGAFAVPELINIGLQVGGALQSAHSAGFVHRDVKPSNIMLTGTGQPLCTKLIDFGLVHATVPDISGKPGDDEAMSEGRFIGTPLFASPEQLCEKPVDGRSDLFSLGMTLWYLAIGAPPETGSSAVIAASRLSAESYASKLPGSLPEPLRQLLARMLEKNQDQRIGSAGEVLSELRRYAAYLGLESATELPEPVSTEIHEVQADYTDAQPVEIKVKSCSMETEFKLLSRFTETSTGIYYFAESQTTGGNAALLHVLHPELVENEPVFNRLRLNVGRIQAIAMPVVILPDSINRYSDYTAVVIKKPAGGDLLTVLKAQGIVSFSAARPFLEAVANASDQIQNLKLPGLDLRPASIFLEFAAPSPVLPPNIADITPKLLPKFLTVQDSALISETTEISDASSTMAADAFTDSGSESDPCSQFATLIYRIVSGRNCHAAASLSPQGYVAVPGLSEQANRILSLIISRNASYASCGELFRELIGVEGVSGSMLGSMASKTATNATSSIVRPEQSIGNRPPGILDKRQTGAAAYAHGSRMQTTHPTLRRTDTATAIRSAAPVAPLPPLTSSIAQSHVQTAPENRLRSTIVLVTIIVTVLLLATGTVIFLKPRVQKQVEQKLPDSLVIRLQDTPAIQPAFKVANIPVTATLNGDDWMLPLQGIPGKFPFNVKIVATGYDTNEFTIRNADELGKTVQCRMDRSRGKIEFVGIPVEYTQASCLMKEALPEEKDHVDIPKYPTGAELHGDATVPLELQTGVYLVNLKGKSVPQRWPVIAAVKRSATFQIKLPPIVEGRYSGHLQPKQGSSSGGSDALEINAVTRHNDGWIQNGKVRQSLVEGRLNPEGAYVARALATYSSGMELSEATIKMRSVDSESYDVYLAPGNKPDEREFVLLGTVKRAGELSAEAAPPEQKVQGTSLAASTPKASEQTPVQSAAPAPSPLTPPSSLPAPASPPASKEPVMPVDRDVHIKFNQ